MLHANLEITQILHNAQGTLYASQDRTLELVFAGDYPPYLEDFQRSAAIWYETWKDVLSTSRIKYSVLLVYEYLYLYVNAFSFQAVLTRLSHERRAGSRKEHDKNSKKKPFQAGLMSSPDGRYIYDAINAARRILMMMNDLNPKDELCFLPSRYYLYGVYAAVFLYKAVTSGAISTIEQREEAETLARKFNTVLDESASTDFHVGHRYSQMLKKLWFGYRMNSIAEIRGHSAGSVDMLETTVPGQDGITQTQGVDDPNFADLLQITMEPLVQDTTQANEWSSWSLDAQLLGPFVPNLPISNGGVYGDRSVEPPFQLSSLMSGVYLGNIDRSFLWPAGQPPYFNEA